MYVYVYVYLYIYIYIYIYMSEGVITQHIHGFLKQTGHIFITNPDQLNW